MATAGVTQGWIECVLCSEQWEDVHHLKCGHIACEKCLKKGCDDKQKSFVCAICGPYEDETASFLNMADLQDATRQCEKESTPISHSIDHFDSNTTATYDAEYSANGGKKQPREVTGDVTKLSTPSVKTRVKIPIGYSITGITMDTRRGQLVARIKDINGPLQLYNYQGALVESLGAGVEKLARFRKWQGLCLDTKRDCFMAMCQGSLILYDRAGQEIKSAKFGSSFSIFGLSYDEDGDRYLVSNCGKDVHKVYLIDPVTLEITRQIGWEGTGPTQFQRPSYIHIGTVAEIGDQCIIVSDYDNECVKLFDVSGAHLKTYSTASSTKDGQPNKPWAVSTDSRSRIIVVEAAKKQIVAYWTDSAGQDHQECILSDDWEGYKPCLLAVDTINRVMAVATLKDIFIYNLI